MRPLHKRMLAVLSLFLIFSLFGCAREVPEDTIESAADSLGDDAQELEELDDLAQELDEDLLNELEELDGLG
ncbi:hypothetical protein HYS49_01400 [Candidatus Woesearchaeota archaeon]|nr:hypothetical protein [Candidatus Woesearchaeota archaeon]